MTAQPGYKLSDEQLRQYFFDGCLLISDFLTAEETKQLQEWTDELESIARTMPYAQLLAITGVSKHLEAIEQADGTQKKEICRIEHFVPFHEGWRSLSSRIAALIGQLFDDNLAAKLYKEKINFKRAGGMGYAPHYDGPSPAAMGLAQTFITAQVAVDDQTPENGCIMGVFPRYDYPDDLEGSLIPPKADGDPEADGRAGAIRPEIAAELPWQFLPCPAGSIFLFNHWFPHYRYVVIQSCGG